MTHKSKTAFWLSVYKNYFKTTFYFIEKNANDIAGLSINKKARETFAAATPIGKLIPLTITLQGETYINDVLKLVEYKMGKL